MNLASILEQVREGTITPEQAQELIAKLQADQAASANPKTGNERPGDFDLGTKIKGFISQFMDGDEMKNSFRDIITDIFKPAGPLVSTDKGKITADGITKISLTCPVGKVEIESGPAGEIGYELLAAENHKADWSVKHKADGPALQFEVQSSLSTRKLMMMSESVKLYLKVPAGIELNIDGKSTDALLTGLKNDINLKLLSGDIESENTFGNMKVHTLSGDVAIADHEGELDLGTTSGDVSMIGVNGGGFIKAVSGDIEVTKCTGKFVYSSMSGDSEIRDVEGEIVIDSKSGDFSGENIRGNVRCKLMSGDISWTSDFALDFGDIDLHTTSGDVKAVIPAASSVAATLKTISGDERIEHSRNPELLHNNKEIVLHEGKAKMSLKSVSGDVTLKLV